MPEYMTSGEVYRCPNCGRFISNIRGMVNKLFEQVKDVKGDCKKCGVVKLNYYDMNDWSFDLTDDEESD